MDEANKKYNEAVGEVLKRKRIELGLTQLAVAEKAGTLTRGHLSLVERGATGITAYSMAGLCKALDIKPDDLLYGDQADSMPTRTDKVFTQIMDDSDAVAGFRLAEELNLFAPLFRMVNDLGGEKVQLLTSEKSLRALKRAPKEKIEGLITLLS